MLAARATHGVHLASGLDAIGRAAAASISLDATAVAGFEAELVAAYAQVSALMGGDDDGRTIGLGLYRLPDRAGRLSGLKRRHLDLYPQLLYAAGRHDDARHALATKLTPSVVEFPARRSRAPGDRGHGGDLARRPVGRPSPEPGDRRCRAAPGAPGPMGTPGPMEAPASSAPRASSTRHDAVGEHRPAGLSLPTGWTAATKPPRLHGPLVTRHHERA